MWLPVLVAFLAAGAQSFDDVAARAAAARDANDRPQAIRLYDEGTRLNPQWAEGWWFLGSLLYDADEYGRARDAMARCVELQPGMSPAFGLLGLSEFQTGDYEHALGHIQRSLQDARLDADMVRVLRFHEAVLLARAGQFDEALGKYAWFAGDANPPATLLAAMGIAALREPLLPAAIPAARRELFGAAGRTVWRAMGGDEARTADAFQKLLGQFPDEPGVHALIRVYLHAVPARKAEAALRSGLDAEPGNAAAAAMLACVLLKQSDAAGALPYATKAVELAPRLFLAQYALGRAMTDTGDLAHAIDHLVLAVQIDPTDLESHISLASAYGKAGRTAEARAERARTIQLARKAVHARS